MKRSPILLLLTLTLLACAKDLFAEIKYKYGKVGLDELQMKIYPNDSSAQAVVLYEEGYTSYVYRNDFIVQTEVKSRIKILKPEGTSKATITIPIYKRGRTEETVSNIEAYAYNLENGQIAKTKLEKSNIFEEKISERYYHVKLAIPNVKEGTVIEYKFTLNSPFYYDIPDWVFQKDIPVQQGSYEAMIPEYFIYKRETKGYEKIDFKETDESQNIILAGRGTSERIEHKSKHYSFKVNNLPALIDDEYIWAISDYLSAVHFELSSTQFPGSFFKPYTSNWETIEKTIKEETDFVKNISRDTPLKDEIKQISGLADEREKIEAIYALIKNKIRWDGKYAFTGNPNDAFKNGTGNNAQINGALISALKMAGTNAYPVLIRRRSEGRLPIAMPSLDKITTFIVAAEKSDGTTHYMDGSATYGGLDMMPTDLLVDRARTFKLSETNDWVNLSKAARNQISVINIAKLSEDGTLEVKSSNYYRTQPAYRFKQDFAQLKDSAEHIEKYEAENNVKIQNISIKGHKNILANTIIEEIEFTRAGGNKEAEIIYINPLIIKHITKNNFTQTERKLPVEFSYPYTFQLTTTLLIPKGYTVEELPKSIKIELEDQAGSLLYNIQKHENVIQLNYRFQLNEVAFSFISYPMLRNFWGMATTKNSEMVVLKKI
jgi:hypothetical protein